MATIEERMRTGRRRWLELDEPTRRALWVDRPSDNDMVRVRQAAGDFTSLMAVAADQVVGWRGFTEADMLGASQGSDSEVQFSRSLFAEWARNESAVLLKVFEFANRLYVDAQPKEDVAKN